MKITSLDIRKQEFARTFRGYDIDEVDSFLQIVATGWQEMVDELRRSEDKTHEQQLKLQHYMKVEEALEEALQTARTSARQTVESAEKKANNLLEEAENRIVGMQKDSDLNRLHVKRDTARYAVRQQEIVAKLRAFLVSEMEILQHFESNTGELTLLTSESPKEITMVLEEEETHEGADVASENGSGTVAPAEETDEAPAAPQDEQEAEDEEGDTKETEDTEEEEYFEPGDEKEALHDTEGQEGGDKDAEGNVDDDTPSWRVNPVFESVEEAAGVAMENTSDGGPTSEDSADEEIKKIHEILKDLDDEKDAETS